MATWVMFFMVWGAHGSSSVSIDFAAQQLCESGRAHLSSIVPSTKDGYFSFSMCVPK